jgi:hypothetical protein
LPTGWSPRAVGAFFPCFAGAASFTRAADGRISTAMRSDLGAGGQTRGALLLFDFGNTDLSM